MYKHIEDNLCIGSKTFTIKCEIQNKPSRCYHESECIGQFDRLSRHLGRSPVCRKLSVPRYCSYNEKADNPS
jgi:hypothetical protein